MIERMHRLATLVRHSLPFNASEAARVMGCDRKTIHRDLTFMRDRLGYDFSWCHHTQKYRCTKKPRPML